MKDYYKVLNISSTADFNDIKKAYRTLALQWHPDKNKSSDAPDTFILINEAYEILHDELRRKTYDKLYAEYLSRQTSQSTIREYEVDYSQYNNWRGEARKEATRKAEMSYSEFSNLIGKVYQGASNGCGIVFAIAMWIAWGPVGVITLLQGAVDMVKNYPVLGFKTRYIFLVLFFILSLIITIVGIIAFFSYLKRISDD